MSDTCETCEQLKEESRKAIIEIELEQGRLDEFLLSPNFDPKDSEREGELRRALENAQKREADVTRRQAEHRQAAHP